MGTGQIFTPTRLMASAGVAALGVGALAPALTVRRWARRDDDGGGLITDFPGVERVVVGHDGAKIFTICLGDGPTVILGHGIAGDHTHWVPVARHLVAAGFKAVVFDQRGHGRSTAGAEGYTVAALGHDVATVVDAYGDEQTVVVGHSMGGIGVQSMLRYRPDVRVAKLVLVASFPHHIDGLIAHLISSRAVLKSFRTMMHNRTLARLAMRGGFGDRFSIEMLDHLAKTWNGTPDETLVGFGAGLSDFSLLDALAESPMPVTVICGTRDAITPIALSEEMASTAPIATMHRIPKAGHMIVWEHVTDLAAIIG